MVSVGRGKRSTIERGRCERRIRGKAVSVRGRRRGPALWRRAGIGDCDRWVAAIGLGFQHIKGIIQAGQILVARRDGSVGLWPRDEASVHELVIHCRYVAVNESEIKGDVPVPWVCG